MNALRQRLAKQAEDLMTTAAIVVIFASIVLTRGIDPSAGFALALPVAILGSALPYIMISRPEEFLRYEPEENSLIWLANALMGGAGILWSMMIVAQEL